MRRLPNIDSSSQPFIGGPFPSTFDDDKTIMGMVMIYVDGDDGEGGGGVLLGIWW